MKNAGENSKGHDNLLAVNWAWEPTAGEISKAPDRVINRWVYNQKKIKPFLDFSLMDCLIVQHFLSSFIFLV